MKWIGRPPRKTGNALEATEKCISIGRQVILLIAMLSALLGSLLIGLYCFHLSRIPQDISSNDAFVLLLTSIAFGAIYIVGLLYATASSIWLLKGIDWLSRRSPKARRAKSTLNFFPWQASLITFLILFPSCVLLALDDRKSAQDLSKLMMAFLAGGFIIAISLCYQLSEDHHEVEKSGSWMQKTLSAVNGWAQSGHAVVFSAGAMLPFALGTWGIFLNVVMLNAGIRIPHTAIILNEENLAYLTAVAKATKIELTTCPIQNTKSALVWPTDLLWHGMGSVSYVRIGPPKVGNAETAAAVVIDLDRKGIRPVKGGQAINFSCS